MNVTQNQTLEQQVQIPTQKTKGPDFRVHLDSMPRELRTYGRSQTLTKLFLKACRVPKVIRPPLRVSALKLFQECPRKYMFQERLGLRRRGEYRSSIEVGILFHDLLAQVLMGSPVEALDRLVAERVRQHTEKLQADADELGLLPNGYSVLDAIETAERDGQMALAMAQAYLHYYPVEKLQQHYEVVALETPYGLRVGGLKQPIVIRVDMLLRHRKTGAYWLLDYKTTGIPANQRALIIPLEVQPRLYLWVLYEVLRARYPNQDIKLGGTIHAVIRRPTIRRRRGELTDEYIERVRNWYHEKGMTDPEDPPLYQSVIPVPNPLVTEDLLRRLAILDRAARCRLNLGFFHPNPASCCGRYGNTVCPYLDICRRRVELWTDVIRENYRHEPRPEEALADDETDT